MDDSKYEVRRFLREWMSSEEYRSLRRLCGSRSYDRSVALHSVLVALAILLAF